MKKILIFAIFLIIVLNFLNIAPQLTGETTSTGARALISVISPFAVVNVEKSDSPDPDSAGSPLNYTITFTNSGAGTATNVTINETFPAGVTFVSSSPPPTFGNNSWFFPSLPGLTSGNITITVLIDPFLPNSTITNFVNLTFFNGTTFLSNTDEENTTIAALTPANVTITKTDFPDPVIAGTLLSYNITLTNSGQINATNVTINETYPPGVTLTAAVPAPTFGNNSWFFSILPGNSYTTIFLNVLVDANVSNGTILTNLANVTFFNGTEFLSVSDEENTTVLVAVVAPPKPTHVTHISICKGELDGPSFVNATAGQTIPFQFTFKQIGGPTLTNIEPTVEGLPFAYTIYPAGIPSLGLNQEQNFTVYVNVPPAAQGFYEAKLKITTQEGCVFVVNFIFYISPVKKVVNLQIEAEPRTCEFGELEKTSRNVRVNVCDCPKYVNYTKSYELGDYIARIKNTGTVNLQDLRFELQVPTGWQAEGTRTLDSLNVGETAEVDWRIIPPLQLEPATEPFKVIVKSSDSVIASGVFEVPLHAPDFEVIIEPSLEQDFSQKSEINAITIINNKYSSVTLEKPAVEYNINRCSGLKTDILDLFEFGDVAVGKGLVFNNTYLLPEQLGKRIYSVHGVLYSKGYFIDESFRTLDLTQRVPIRKVVPFNLLLTVALVVAAAIALLVYRLIKKRRIRARWSSYLGSTYR